MHAFEIYNLAGNRIYSDLKVQGLMSKEISVSNLPQGIYILKVYSGKKTYIKKIVIQ
jgi:hypothetical protein